jgi:hypothetical protein
MRSGDICECRKQPGTKANHNALEHFALTTPAYPGLICLKVFAIVEQKTGATQPHSKQEHLMAGVTKLSDISASVRTIKQISDYYVMFKRSSAGSISYCGGIVGVGGAFVGGDEGDPARAANAPTIAPPAITPSSTFLRR